MNLFKPATPEMIANRPPVPREKEDWGHSPCMQVLSMMRAAEVTRRAFDDYMYAKFVMGKWDSDRTPETCTESKLKMRSEWAFRRLDE